MLYLTVSKRTVTKIILESSYILHQEAVLVTHTFSQAGYPGTKAPETKCPKKSPAQPQRTVSLEEGKI